MLFQRCGGFTGGMSAIDHATNGVFDQGATTKWKRGSNVEVVWRGTQHGGQLHLEVYIASLLCQLLSSHLHIISKISASA